jgi:DNA-binding PadR family transcriptional regulator
MQDRIVLGFLLDGGKTGYEIKKMMELSTSNFFNTSLGSIYPALKKLERNKMVKLEEKVERGRLKKLYTTTPKGKKYFYEWLSKEPAPFKIRAEALLKIFFFSYVPDDIRKKHIDITMDQLDVQMKELKDIQEFGKEISKEVNIDFFQMLCLKYGIDFLLFTQGILKDLKSKLSQSGKILQENK